MRTIYLGGVALLLAASFGFNSSITAEAKGAVKRTPVSAPVSDTSQSSDQVVTKNDDGSVEVTDAQGEAPAAAAPSAGTRQIIYKHAPAGTIRYADGTVVTRHADGSCEVSDGDSASPAVHWTKPATSASRAKHSSKPAKRHH